MSNFSNLSINLPEEISFTPRRFGVIPEEEQFGNDSYFDIEITGGTILDGTFDAYCIDTDRGIASNGNVTYNAKVYSTYEELPPELLGTGNIESPENFDLVNWIVNQNFAGKTASNGEVFTFGDIQRAIWALLDDENLTAGLGSWTEEKASEIISLAEASGEGFVPSYEYTTIFGEQVTGKMAVILSPFNNNNPISAQIVMAEVELSKLGDVVFYDTDQDGIQDSGEEGIAGVTVNLLADVNGDGVIEESEVIHSTTTDDNGKYHFEVIAGDYRVQFEQPEGFEVSPANQGNDDSVDSDGLISDVVTLDIGEFDPTIDQGFYAIPMGSIGDTIFRDDNANGVQEVEEAGISGVEVRLTDKGADGIFGTADDVVIGTQTTDGNGKYLFEDLEAGNYQVEVLNENGALDGLKQTADPDAILDNGSMVELEPGENNLDQDFGYDEVTPGIDIEKFTNGVDADTPEEAVEIAAGDTVTWTYEVTNTGNVSFDASEITVTDDQEGIISNITNQGDGDNTLAPGETWIYEKTGTAQDLITVTSSQDITFHLTGNSYTTGHYGNVRTFTEDGVSVDVSAFSFNQDQGWRDAYLGAYSGGLGVTNRNESGSLHRIDNGVSIDYVLFEFDQDVTVDRAFLDYVSGDSDISVWIGDRNGDISYLNSDILDGFAKEYNNGGKYDRWADFNADGLTGDTLVISARDDHSHDAFKLKKLDISVPGEKAIGTYTNIGTVVAGSVSDEDQSGYTNPEIAVQPVHYEAEDLHLNGYRLEHVGIASGGEVIKLKSHVYEGSATKNFGIFSKSQGSLAAKT
ncbi:SdrD B-like domain-containing protein [Crocosphaera sp. Alani8]|uniref:SdrD B-like domain-containing protein n=1 Tax=Crocosphaera sp. Alani8 TaxID=3038952 RepID=UPI00313BF3FE